MTKPNKTKKYIGKIKVDDWTQRVAEELLSGGITQIPESYLTQEPKFPEIEWTEVNETQDA